MSVAQTSLEAHASNIIAGVYPPQHQSIIDCLKSQGVPTTRREIVNLTGIEINAVTGRVNELIKAGVLEETAPQKCTITGRNVHPVQLKGRDIPMGDSEWQIREDDADPNQTAMYSKCLTYKISKRKEGKKWVCDLYRWREGAYCGYMGTGTVKELQGRV